MFPPHVYSQGSWKGTYPARLLQMRATFPHVDFSFFLFFFSRFPCCWFGVVRSDESSAAWFGLVAFAFFFSFFPIVGRLQNRLGEISGVTSVPYLGKGKEGGNWLAVVSKNTRSCAAVFVTPNNTALAVCLFVLWGFWCVCVCVCR